MAKNTREKIKLISTSGSKHYYTTTKNKRNQPKKLQLKKYDPIIKKHILYKEHKIK
ncbi:MAG: 50S ribosomal protein L33 [Buchnera aphidicola (Eriosoma harunire)]